MSAESRRPRLTHREFEVERTAPGDWGGSAAVSEHLAAYKLATLTARGASGNSSEAANIDCKIPPE